MHGQQNFKNSIACCVVWSVIGVARSVSTRTLCFTPFTLNARWRYTPFLNWRPRIFGLKPFGWPRIYTLTPACYIISYRDIIFIYPSFSRNKTRAQNKGLVYLQSQQSSLSMFGVYAESTEQYVYVWCICRVKRAVCLCLVYVQNLQRSMSVFGVCEESTEQYVCVWRICSFSRAVCQCLVYMQCQ
jgi:hypothetical protein